MVLSVIQTQLLIQAHLTRETADLPPTLNGDLKRVLELAHHLLEELMKMALIPRTAQGHGWLRPAIGVVELSQCVIQGVGCAPDVCRVFCRESRCCSQIYRECGVRLLLCAILCCVPFYCVCCFWLLGSGLYSSNFFCCFVV
ncbi:dnaJ protein ERDJ2A-like isoform X2 [Spinacia oleracea]|uniref:DnaJ protein ERDJ2A-like isoform X2 n=1 Tax=Spinacia oleracea TaxID=3562 RepID=A0ABM3RW87_SPIOL|nr:dnaJ protein ERDJ2A-like isoform X2 [Spinacia oleracea]